MDILLVFFRLGPVYRYRGVVVCVCVCVCVSIVCVFVISRGRGRAKEPEREDGQRGRSEHSFVHPFIDKVSKEKPSQPNPTSLQLLTFRGELLEFIVLLKRAKTEILLLGGGFLRR